MKKYVELAQSLLKETVNNNKEEGKSILSDFKSNNSEISQFIKVTPMGITCLNKGGGKSSKRLGKK